MTAAQQVNQVIQHPASADVYISHGWGLCAIPPNTKGPRTPGWQHKENMVKSQADILPGHGMGLCHAYSGTMALDIDSWDVAAGALIPHGLDINVLYAAPDAVIIDSGRAGHGKLLYAMPAGITLRSKKIIIGGQVAYELRCATATGLTVQDILPPTIHPLTQQPYRWAGNGHWSRLPTIPLELLNMWQALLTADTERVMACNTNFDASWDEIHQALEFISSDCDRDTWIKVGMALHFAGTRTDQLDNALALWNEWSKQCEARYPGEAEILTQWASFKGDKAVGIRIGTLFKLAKDGGWVRPIPDASMFFKPVDGQPLVTEDESLIIFTPKPPKLDFSLLPDVLATRASQIAETVGCDPMIPLFAGLGAACAVIDSRIRLEIRPGYKVPPVLWLMTIGEPGDKKSPGSSEMLELINQIESEDRERYAKALLDWEGVEAMCNGVRKAWLDASASAEGQLVPVVAPTNATPPPKPVDKRLTINDVTSQKLVRMTADRPQGLLAVFDELSSWIGRMCDPKSGDDRGCWVQGYDSRSYVMDRVGVQGAIKAENHAVSIYGNVQPSVFKNAMSKLETDGLLQRFIPAAIDGDMAKRGKTIPDFLLNKGQWEQAIRCAHAMPVQVYRFSDEAQSAFEDYEDWYYAQRDDDRLLLTIGTFMTAYSKLEGLHGRLCLVLHMLESPFSPMVSAAMVRRVSKMIKHYIVPMFRYTLIELAGVSQLDTWVREWIIQHCVNTQYVSLSDLKRSARVQLKDAQPWQEDQLITNAMYPLENEKWVVRIDDRSKEGKHFTEWAIDPALKERFAGYRARSNAAKKRAVEQMYADNPTSPRTRVKGIDY